jgi:hypothetical protein
MVNKWDIQREVGNLDKLINELSIDLVAERQRSAQNSAKDELVKEMEEALCELRQARGLSNLLVALDQRKEAAWDKKGKRNTSH